MFEGLDEIPWGRLEHAYGSARDVPGLLRRLAGPDTKDQRKSLRTLYGSVLHQGTRYSATPYVVPFVIRLCADPAVPRRADLLRFWGELVTGGLSVRDRPLWGDGERVHWAGGVQDAGPDDPDAAPLHRIYRESLRGYPVLEPLLTAPDAEVRAGAAWVLACLPTLAESSGPLLRARRVGEPSARTRAALVFALGELSDPESLQGALADDPAPAVRCIAACQLARLQPSEELVGPLLGFLSHPPKGYEHAFGAGGPAGGDVAHALSQLPTEVQRLAIPALGERLAQARQFATIPLVEAMLAAAFPCRQEALTELNELQRDVLARMVATQELWRIGNLSATFREYGLRRDREACARLAGVEFRVDEPLLALSEALGLVEIGFLDRGREGILRALALDPDVFHRAPAADECWMLCAKAFSETDPDRAHQARRNAQALNPELDDSSR